MIDNERLKNLSEDELEQISDFSDEFDCFGLECTECPFELENSYTKGTPAYFSYRCAIGYAKELYRRLNE